MKSAHKLAAALAVLVALLVAAYFLLTALQAARGGGGGGSDIVPTTPPSAEPSEATTPAPASTTTTASPQHDRDASGAPSQQPPVSVVTTLEVQPASVEVSQEFRSTEVPPEKKLDELVQPVEVITQPSSETSSTTSSATSPAETGGPSTSGPSTGAPPSSTTAAPSSTDATQRLYEEATSSRPPPPAGGEQPPSDGGGFQLTPEEGAAWDEFRAQHRRAYPSVAEERRRAAIFAGNLRFINAYNKLPGSTFQLGVNKFADMERNEINALMIGPQMNWTSTMPRGSTGMPPSLHILPDPESEVQTRSGGEPAALPAADWRGLAASAPPDQGTCLESSLFAVVASLESTLNAMRAGANDTARVKLSESQVIDCLAYNAPPPPTSWPPVCAGQLSMVHVLDFLQRQAIRLASLQEYDAFKQAQMRGAAPPGICVPPLTPGALDTRPKVGSYGQVHRDNIDEALLNRGPLVVALDASQPTFHFYKSGLYHELACSSDTYNLHALLVGFAPAAQDGDTSLAHYTLRASLGPNWGEAGHMRLLKDAARNKCLPQQLATYPNLAFE